MIIAIVLIIEMSSLLVGEGASKEVVDKIAVALTADGQIDRVIHLRTLYLGPENLLVAAKIAITAAQPGDQIAAAIDAAEERVRTAVPDALTIYLEPDLDRSVTTA